MTATFAHRPTIAVTRHAIAAGHYLAATAGFAILRGRRQRDRRRVRRRLALGVLQSDLVDVAGVAPIMVYLAKSKRGRDDRRAWRLAQGARPRTVHARARRQNPEGGDPHRCPGRTRRLDYGFAPLWHDELWRGRGGGDSARARRFSDVPADGREPEASRGRPSSLAVLGGDLSAGRAGPRDRRSVSPDRSCRLPAIHGRRGTRRRRPQSQWSRSRGRARGGARCVLPRRHRQKDRRLYEGAGRAAVGRGPCRIPFAGRPARAPPLWRSRGLYLRRLVPRAGIAANPGLAGGHRPLRSRPQQRRLCPPSGRGAEARLCRPRGLLRRPGNGRGPARDPDLRRVRGRAPQADPPRPRLAGNAAPRGISAANSAARPAAASAGSRAPRATRTPNPTPPMSASPTATATCSQRPRATGPTARRWCRGPASSRRTAARSRVPTRATRPGWRPANGRG